MTEHFISAWAVLLLLGVQVTMLSFVFWVLSGCVAAGSTALVTAVTIFLRKSRAVAMLILQTYLAAYRGLQAAYVYHVRNHRGWRCFSAALPVGLAGELQNLPASAN